MLRVLDSHQPLCDGLSRREWLRIGGIGLGGLTLEHLLARANASSPSGSRSFGKAKSVILLCLLGGPPQHETWDPKPDAPAEIRGDFGTIPSRTPGLRVGELMPRVAQITDQLAVLRAVVTNDNAHSSSGYQMLTGVPHQPRNAENVTAKAPNLAPSIGAMVRYLRPAPGQLPSAITIPEHVWNDGNIPWPGQDAGQLGRRYNPWLIPCDPSASSFTIDSLALPENIPAERFEERRTLLTRLNQHLDLVLRSGELEGHQIHSQKAFELLSSGAARRAFNLEEESPKVRDRYGRTRFGQSTLLARRLVEAGVSLVQVNWTRIKDELSQGMWDTHSKHSESCKKPLMPMMDQTFSALIEDLRVRGMLDETLVVWFGEFGRTPKINKAGGRDHWGSVFSLALAGGGIKAGVVHGTSDKHAAYPLDGRVEARDLIATIFHCLGFAPDTELRDSENRPLFVSRGEPIKPILL